MSANNFTLIKKYKKDYLVFYNLMAESWCDRNCLNIKQAVGKCKTEKEAEAKALRFEEDDETEYGIVYGVLAKDGAEVSIFED